MTAQLVQKIQFYKKVLLGLYFLCAVSLCASLTLNAYYFFKKSAEFSRLKNLSTEMQVSLRASDSKASLAQSQLYMDEIKVVEESALTLQSEIFVSVVCIIIFGLVLPYLLILQIKKKVEDLQKKMELQVQAWVRTWMEEYQRHGSEAHQKSEFWLKIVLLTVEQLSQFSSHPAFYLGAEVARIVRTEMNKQS